MICDLNDADVYYFIYVAGVSVAEHCFMVGIIWL